MLHWQHRAGHPMLSSYGPYYPLVIVLAGFIAALIVWAFPGTHEWIGFMFAIASVALPLASIVLDLLS
jgi:prepilin signal peptidase PulO-like enzyme (type II secretory pathway)